MLNWIRRLPRRLWPRAEAGVTLNTLGTGDTTSVTPTLWGEVFNYAADRKALSTRLSGADGSDAPVIEKTELTKVPGDTIRFPLMGRLLASPRSGTQELEGQEEKIPVGFFSVSVTYYRHATAIDKITMKVSQIKWPSDANRLLANWLARVLDDDWMNQVLNTETTTAVTIFGGNKASRSAIQDADILTPTQLSRLHLLALRRGVSSFRTTRFGQMPWPVFGACMSEIDYYMLKGQSDFAQDMRLAAPRGDDNPIITGLLPDMYKGIVLYVFNTVNPGDGFLGTYLRPEGLLRTAVNTTDTSLSIGPATQVSNVNYSKYFPATGTVRIGSELMTLTANASNSLTLSTRGASNSTAAAHSVGDLVTLNNLGKVFLFGQHAVMRGWAQKPALDEATVSNIRQERSYGFERGIGVDYQYGIKAVLAPGDSQPMNYAILEVSAPNPNNIG